MSWPYIGKEVVNTGSVEAPDFQVMPKITWVPGNNRGPYEQCKDCRANKASNPKAQVGFSVPGASRCAKHIIRYHRDNGSLTDELKADILAREAANTALRMGAFQLNEK